MVRLKALAEVFKVKPLTISIPYGAIKRFFFSTVIPLVIIFQFLMVRLKE